MKLAIATALRTVARTLGVGAHHTGMVSVALSRASIWTYDVALLVLGKPVTDEPEPLYVPADWESL